MFFDIRISYFVKRIYFFGIFLLFLKPWVQSCHLAQPLQRTVSFSAWPPGFVLRLGEVIEQEKEEKKTSCIAKKVKKIGFILYPGTK
jgi:hypothetical protein